MSRRNAVTVQLRQAIHRLGRQFTGGDCVRILERVDGAMLLLLQPPRTAQIDDAQTVRDGLWYKRPRRFMRSSQEKQLHTLPLQLRPRKRPQRIASITRQLRKYLRQIRRTIPPVFTAKQQRRLQPRMALEKARQLQAGIAARSEYRAFELRRHQPSISSIRTATFLAASLSGQTIRIASSPAIVPTTSSHSCSSSAAATG